jgi:hypothetical protein
MDPMTRMLEFVQASEMEGGNKRRIKREETNKSFVDKASTLPMTHTDKIFKQGLQK